ncbi:MAG: TIGR01210 family radical SAM protein [Thermoplasmata archaeon]|nr:TIGR01210 family radical SAM protein [Thermoplasmata archaeon]
MDEDATTCSFGLIPSGKPAKKIHHLVKAPENTPGSIRKRESWDADELAVVYTTPERLPSGKFCEATTVIFRTRGCVWWWKSGCTFCGYFNDVRDDVTLENLLSQWEEAKQKTNNFEGSEVIKIYTSGTFFEDRENPPEWQEIILRETHQMGLRLIVEARAEMCTPEKIAWVAERHPGCVVAIGLEALDDEVLKFHCNKGFSTKQWHRAINTLRENNLEVKTYLLFKPPFMSEGDALHHSIEWISKVAPLSDEVSVNPMNIQNNTIVERLFRNSEYRPPWLWSLVEMIRQVHPVPGRLIVHPTAAGRIRGAHNCGECDKNVAAAIERYSVSNDIIEFEGLSCDCEKVWRTEIDLDTSIPIPLGVGLDRRISDEERLMSP